MAASVSVKYLGSRDREVRLHSLLATLFQEYDDTWTVRVLGSLKTHSESLR